MTDAVQLHEFRIENGRDGVIHLVFDMPDRSMNVFSNAAIHELGRFARWLRTAEVAGVVVRSGKSAFCAGADLNELGAAYDIIMDAPPEARTQVAFEHFFALSRALRALETAGKPVAAVIDGLALGGGCELALGCHYRVMTDTPRTAIGLPEALVGLLPGAGGTQRLPRLIGVTAALPVLLDGKRLSPSEALVAGAADDVVPAEQAVEAAERWILSRDDVAQPWDQPGWSPRDLETSDPILAQARATVFAQTKGHYPAPPAILACIERGLPLPMDQAIREEMVIFSNLIQRIEPRNMIQTLFVGKLDFDRRAKAGTLPRSLDDLKAALLAAWRDELDKATIDCVGSERIEAAFRMAGLQKVPELLRDIVPRAPEVSAHPLRKPSASAGFWFEAPTDDVRGVLAARLILAGAAAAKSSVSRLDEAEQRMADYAVVSAFGFPAYLGGPCALLRYLGFDPPVNSSACPLYNLVSALPLSLSLHPRKPSGPTMPPI